MIRRRLPQITKRSNFHSSLPGHRCKADNSNVVKKLAPRWFLMRDAHAREGTVLLQPRWAISLMLGPMTRREIRRALGKETASAAEESAPELEINA